jgi:VCBS repeat-containing protein
MTYQVFDGTEYSGIVTVTIIVNPVNDAPIANEDDYTINEDIVLQVDAAAGVLVNDTDVDGDSLTAALISGPSHGSLTFHSDGAFTYTPDLNWYGVDTFIYEASDGTLADTATVTITVNPVNDPPVAVDDYVVLDEDTSVIIDFMANDYDVDDRCG